MFLCAAGCAAQQFQPLRGSLRLEHERFGRWGSWRIRRVTSRAAFVVARGRGMERWWRVAGCRPGPALGGPSGLRSAGSSSVMARWRRSQPARVVTCRPECPSFYRYPMGRPRPTTWGSSSGPENGQSIRSQPLPTRVLAHAFTCDGGSADAPVGARAPDHCE